MTDLEAGGAMFAPNASTVSGRLLNVLPGPTPATEAWEIAVESSESFQGMINEAANAVGSTIRAVLNRERIAQSAARPVVGDRIKLQVEFRSDGINESYVAVGDPPLKL